MNLERLAYILTMERESDRLQQLDGSFYEEAALYIKRLEEARGNASHYKEAAMIDDEAKNGRIMVEGIFDRRMSKIIEYASIASAGTAISVEGLTAGEKAIYDALVVALEKGRNEILMPVLELPGRKVTAKNISCEPASKEKPIENSLTSHSDREQDVMTVKVLKDIPTFVGVDGRHYRLSEEDVVVLPKANAIVLCNKNVATPLESGK